MTDEFFVLALRHDPPPRPSYPRGALDPTGPVFWLRFWPVKDPDYYEDEGGRLRDDRHLEAFLDEAFAYVNLDRWILAMLLVIYGGADTIFCNPSRLLISSLYL